MAVAATVAMGAKKVAIVGMAKTLTVAAMTFLRNCGLWPSKAFKDVVDDGLFWEGVIRAEETSPGK